MPVLNYNELKPGPEAEVIYRRWLANLNEEFTRHQNSDRRSEIVRDELHQIYLGRPHGGRMNATLASELATNTLLESFDPRNITLEPEYYGDVDAKKYAGWFPLEKCATWSCVEALKDAGLWEKRSEMRIGMILGLGAEWMQQWDQDFLHGGNMVFDTLFAFIQLLLVWVFTLARRLGETCARTKC